MIRHRLVAALVATGLCAFGAGCGKNDDSDERSLLELRPVVASTPPPCAENAPEEGEVVLPLNADDKVECLKLAQPIVDAKDVRSATVADTPSNEPALSVVLGAVGSANLDGYAKRNLGERLAIVSDGVLVSAPVLRDTSFAGRIQVTGLSKEKTEDLFRRLNKLIKH